MSTKKDRQKSSHNSGSHKEVEVILILIGTGVIWEPGFTGSGEILEKCGFKKTPYNL